MKRKAAPGAFSRRFWRALTRLAGEPPAVTALGESIAEWRRRTQELEQQLRLAAGEREQNALLLKTTRAELERAREERLQWMAKEASVRKELQDCQERNKELLEKVVGLTHQQREMKQSLLDQKFRTEATPLERTRFEAELAEARARVREAEQRTRVAEEATARLKSLESEAARVKEIEERLVWEAQRSERLESALAATLERVRQLETRLEAARAAPSAAPARTRRPYHKPRIRFSRPADLQVKP